MPPTGIASVSVSSAGEGRLEDAVNLFEFKSGIPRHNFPESMSLALLSKSESL